MLDNCLAATAAHNVQAEFIQADIRDPQRITAAIAAEVHQCQRHGVLQRESLMAYQTVLLGPVA